MSDEQRNFLSLPRYTALISLTGACWLPGLAEHQGKIWLSGDGRFKSVPLGSHATEVVDDLLFEITE
jgi:hypothetical protein